MPQNGEMLSLKRMEKVGGYIKSTIEVTQVNVFIETNLFIQHDRRNFYAKALHVASIMDMQISDMDF